MPSKSDFRAVNWYNCFIPINCACITHTSLSLSPPPYTHTHTHTITPKRKHRATCSYRREIWLKYLSQIHTKQESTKVPGSWMSASGIVSPPTFAGLRGLVLSLTVDVRRGLLGFSTVAGRANIYVCPRVFIKIGYFTSPTTFFLCICISCSPWFLQYHKQVTVKIGNLYAKSCAATEQTKMHSHGLF